MVKIHYDEAAVKRLLRSREVEAAVENMADAIADKVRAHPGWDGRVEHEPGDVDIPVAVHTHDDGELTGSVVLAHPAGLAVQAKHGALTRAAAELGLEVHG